MKDKKKILYITGGILLTLLILGLIVYHFGKKAGGINLSTPVIDNPGNPSNNTTPSVSNIDINSLATALYEDMKGANLFGHNTNTWSALIILSDTDFVRTYNQFDTQYQKDSGQTMKQWVENEQYTIVPYSQWDTIRNSVLKRMAKLNLA